MRILFAVYMLFLIKVILFKYPFEQLKEIVNSWSGDVFFKGIHRANFEWFRTINMYIRYWGYREINSFANLIGNILLFVPFGYMLPRLTKWAKKLPFFFVVLLGLVFGLEFTQLCTNFGAFDVDDILLNCLGGLIGYFLSCMVTGREKNLKE